VNNATLTWSAPGGAVTGYRVYSGTAPRAYNQALGAGTYVTATSSTLINLTKGLTYYFAVTTVGPTGEESVYSDEVSKVID
jgi:fibronectin type 3 domain-containing protein